ncbi:MAG: hypothetical protein WC527_02655 [Candidatus Margulisiibacteriota bacterium]
MPIDGTPSSNQQAAFGGAGGVASTGFDRIYGKDKKDQPIDPEAQAQFKNAFVDIINTDATQIVDTKRERKPMEEQLLYQEELKRISDHRLSTIVKPAEKKPREKPPEQEEEKKTATAAEAKDDLSAEEYMSTSDRLKTVEEDLLKNYIALSAKQIVGKPKNALEGVILDLGALKNELLMRGTLMNDFVYLDQKTSDLIKESFLALIKEKFSKSTETPLEMAEWVLSSKRGKSIVELLALFEKDSISISEKEELLKIFDIPDLVQIATYLHLDIDSWMGVLQKESIKIHKPEGMDIFFHILELPKMEKLSTVTDSYRLSEITYMTEDSFIKKIGLFFKLAQLRDELELRGVSKDTIEEIKTQARKIAWLRTIAGLKEIHLNRILTTSSMEFINSSRKIERLTKRAKKLGFDIPQEGIKWIETGLTQLGLDTAKYKLELLRSLQKISYEDKREEDISRLVKIISSLTKKINPAQ